MSLAELVMLVSATSFFVLYAVLARSVPRRAGVGFVSRLRVHYATTYWSAWSDWLQAVFSIGSVVVYVWETYRGNDAFFECIEAALAVFFIFNWLLEMTLSEERVRHFFSFQALVDLITSVPVLVAVLLGRAVTSANFMRMYRVVKVTRVTRPLRLNRVPSAASPGEDAVALQTMRLAGPGEDARCAADHAPRGAIAFSEGAVALQTMRLAGYFVSTLFLAAGLVQALAEKDAKAWKATEQEGASMAFHDALYFVVITFATVGYGDITPPEWKSRLVVIGLVGFFFFVVPRELNRLNQLLDLGSKYKGSMPKRLVGRHVVLSCDAACRSLAQGFLDEFFHEGFLDEFFHEGQPEGLLDEFLCEDHGYNSTHIVLLDHGYNSTHVVLLVPAEPDHEWKSLVLQFSKNERALFLHGDLRNEADAQRAALDRAAAVFILTDRNSVDLREAEKRTFMRALSARHANPHAPVYVQAEERTVMRALSARHANPSATVYVQVMGRRTKERLVKVMGRRTKERLVKVGLSAARIVCITDTKTLLLANTLLWDGAATLVRNLLVSSGDGGGDGTSPQGDTWRAEYTVGQGKEMYTVALPDFGGAAVSAVACELYCRHGVLLLGLCRRDRVLMGPTSAQRIVAGDMGLVIADDLQGAEGAVAASSAALAANGAAATKHRQSLLTAIAKFQVPWGHQGKRTSRPSSQRGSPAGGHGGGHEGHEEGGDLADGSHIVVVTPTLADMATLAELLLSPQAFQRELVVVCPLPDWNREQDDAEVLKLDNLLGERGWRLVHGRMDEDALHQADLRGAWVVLLKSGCSEPGQSTEESDAETISQLVEVVAHVGGDKRVIVELQDMTCGAQYEILMSNVKVISNLAGTLKGLRTTYGSWRTPPPPPSKSPASAVEVAAAAAVAVVVAAAAAHGLPSPRNLARPPLQHPNGKGERHLHWTLSPGFASGAIVPSNFAETLLCQSFYNPEIIKAVEALLGGGRTELGSGRGRGGGSAFLAQVHPPAAFFTECRPDLSDIEAAVLAGMGGPGGAPDFQHLLRYMMRHYGALPIGLLRPEQRASEPGGAPSPRYVVCCPDRGAAVARADRAFVLVPSLDSWRRMLREPGMSVAPGVSLALTRDEAASAKGQAAPPGSHGGDGGGARGGDAGGADQCSARDGHAPLQEGGGGGSQPFSTEQPQPPAMTPEDQFGGYGVEALLKQLGALSAQVGQMGERMAVLEQLLVQSKGDFRVVV
ncbi:hypothetical protein JKP88DRAFT_324679 [Tribonema minus]|uniref:Uncharacterized protein n=1 Tax=Tribonema minus TaxID=303371 RepID=A0A835YS46_9STRA|nr:hypothetical protein JKP88DRAFT_324679 [Tribonema minus]